MQKFIKVEGIATHGTLLIPVNKIRNVETALVGTTIINYNSGGGSDVLTVSHANLSAASDRDMVTFLTETIIAAQKTPWHEPMYTIQASDAPKLISNIVIA